MNYKGLRIPVTIYDEVYEYEPTKIVEYLTKSQLNSFYSMFSIVRKQMNISCNSLLIKNSNIDLINWIIL